MQALSRTAGGALRARGATQRQAAALWHRSAHRQHAQRVTPIRRFANDSNGIATQKGTSSGTNSSPAAQLEQLSSRIEAVERECAALRSGLQQEEGTSRQRPSSSRSDDSSSSSSNGSKEASHSGHHKRSKGQEQERRGTDAASGGQAKEENKPKIAADENTPEAETENKLRSLHPKIVAWLNAGHLESQRRVTEALMKQEWEGEVRGWAARKGVSDFEKHLAEEAEKEEDGKKDGARPGWETLSKLYALLDAPSDKDLEQLIKDEPHRMAARAFITQALFEQRKELYKRSSDQAKTLADLMVSGQQSGLGALWSGVKALLPIPGFLKK